MTSEQVAMASLTELRDWCVMQDGWEKFIDKNWAGGDGREIEAWKKMNQSASSWDVSYSHPHKPTLDGAARAMPDGWYIHIEQYCTPPHTWFAYARPTGQTHYRWGPEDADGECDCLDPHARGNDEIITRYRLAVLCRLANKKGTV